MDQHQLLQIQLSPQTHMAISAANMAQAQPNGRLFMCSALYLTLCEGQTEKVLALLQRDGGGAAAPLVTVAGGNHARCDLREVTVARNTALHIAAEQGHTKLVRELVSRESSLLSAQNAEQDTPLHCAARAGSGEAVPFIVRMAQGQGLPHHEISGILAIKNEAGDTALHVAARHGHGAAVEAVASASPWLSSVLNHAGASPLYLAAMSGSERAVRAIIRSVDASAAGPSSQNALHAAVFQTTEMVSLLLQWRPTLAGEVDGDGSTPLHFASSDGDLSVVRAILRSAPRSVVPMQDSEGLSALHAAALMGHAGVVKKLLKACPDAVELRDGHGGTFLHAAAKKGHSSVVLLALQKQHTMGSVLNAQDRHGNTSLHIAVLAGNAGIVHLMASSGTVRVNVMNKDGLTPFDLAEKSTSFISMLNLVVALSGAGAQFRPQRQDHVKRWSGGGGGLLWSETTPDSLVVVAVLIATVAFSAAFNVPGSYGGDGKAQLAGQRMYRAFLILDTVAMLSSVLAVMLLVAVKASRPPGTRKAFVFSLHCIWVSLVSMMLAFYAAVRATDAADTGLAYTTLWVSLVSMICSHTTLLPWRLGSLIRWEKLSMWWRNYLWERRRHQATRRRIGRQYPLVGYYIRSMAIFLAVFALAPLVAVQLLAPR